MENILIGTVLQTVLASRNLKYIESQNISLATVDVLEIL